MTDPTNHLIVLLLLLPMVMGLACVPLVNHRGICRALGVISFGGTFLLAVGLLFCAHTESHDGILVTQMGGWLAPYGISLVFDNLSGLLVAAAALVALTSHLYSFATLSARAERRYYHPLVNFMMLGVNLSFMTGDLFNLFVAFEIMLMASYGLLVIGGSAEQLRQAYKYVVMNLLASAVFVIAAGMTYGMLGTLNMADLARITQELADKGDLPTGFAALSVMFLFVFALKAGVFPLWFWLPDTYPTLPIPLAALFGGVLTKVGVYAIARTFPMIFMAGEAAAVIEPILLWGSAFTMAVGVLGALAFPGLRRVLCMLVIVGVGYAMFGVAVGSGEALGGSAFYMVQSMLVMCAAFMCCGLIEKKSGTDDLRQMGGMLQGNAWLATAFFVVMLSIVGLPPFSGFWGKLVMIREGLAPNIWPVAVVAMVAGAFTLLAVLRAWAGVFWNPVAGASESARPDEELSNPGFTFTRGATVVVVAASLFMGFAAEPFAALTRQAGESLAEHDAYVEAVLLNPRYLRDADAEPYHKEHEKPDTPHDDSLHHAANPAAARVALQGATP